MLGHNDNNDIRQHHADQPPQPPVAIDSEPVFLDPKKAAVLGDTKNGAMATYIGFILYGKFL